jgi:hypothetical protein
MVDVRKSLGREQLARPRRCDGFIMGSYMGINRGGVADGRSGHWTRNCEV